MKIAVRGGHNFKAIGAKGLICETTENRKVKDSLIKYLKQYGCKVLDVTPNDMDSNSDLKYGVHKANEWGAELFLSVHFNKAYDNYNGGIGTECWVLNSKSNAKKFADKICINISKLGFNNRGVKFKELYELKNTKMSAIIIECCFVEATKDVEIYTINGSDRIGNYIAQSIVNDASTSNNLFRVKIDGKQIGAYSNLDNIIEAIKKYFGAKLIEIEKI